MPLAYPDAETELMDLLDLIPDSGPSVTHLPLDFTPPLKWVQRIGGAPDPWDITDYPLMKVSYYGPNRTAAQNLANDGTRLILGYKGRRLPSGTFLDFSAVDFGSGIDPDLDPDDRRITYNYTLGFRRQYHLLGA
jgi:hypothetical protein